ncbi:MAG: HK97 family phage prohead protease [Chloroflexi bacterium]|nr:HK97 family phage prohead protease [Chloroflexota bacterium]
MATAVMDGDRERVDVEERGSHMVTKWLSMRAVEAAGADSTVVGKAPGEETGGTLTLVASTDAEDRAGDVISAAGWDLAAYRENPVFLWAHDYRRPAIGRSVRTWVQDGPGGGRLMATIEFAPTPFAQEIRSLYAAGFMRGVSVGFRALEIEPRTGVGGRRGVSFKRQELLEISAAPVPVNPGALVRVVARDGGESGGSARAEEMTDGRAACLRSLAGLSGLPPAVPSGLPAPLAAKPGLAAATPAPPAAMTALSAAKKEIREFWVALAVLAGAKWGSSEADVAGGN